MVEGAGRRRDLRSLNDGIFPQTAVLIKADRWRRRLAPSAIGSTPGFRRGRPMVPLTRFAGEVVAGGG